jgi:hypothetical protein
MLCSSVELYRHFEENYHLYIQGRRVSEAGNQQFVFCLAYSSTVNMEALCPSETFVDFRRTTLQYEPEDRTLRSHCCENLKPKIYLYLSVSALSLCSHL